MSEDTEDEPVEFETTLIESFRTEYGADEEVATAAAANAVAFRDDHDEELTTDDVLDALAATPYDEFAHAFDDAIGQLADESEDCTDSRAYRLTGFGDLAADPTQGA